MNMNGVAAMKSRHRPAAMANGNGRHKPQQPYLQRHVSTPVWFFVLLLLFVVLGQYMAILHFKTSTNVDHEQQNLRMNRRSTDLSVPSHTSTHLDDTSNVPIPTRADGTPLSLEERLRYLELKTNANFNFGSNPFFGSQLQGTCRKQTDLSEFGCVKGENGYKEGVPLAKNCPGYFDHCICLDRLPKPARNNNYYKPAGKKKEAPCLVYDFGVRDMPTFGAVMAKTFGCEVHAFDPSPVSAKWWSNEKELRKMPHYHFHRYGAGGVDGELELKEYDWGQVSIIRYPSWLVDCANKTGSEPCKLNYIPQQSFKLPVKTLPTIIKELGHEGRKIDILKVDVEGSEFAFLEHMFDTMGCPDFVDQVAIEWHHYPNDVRYGEGSSPPINALTTLFSACGLKLFWQHSVSGWKSPERIFYDLDMKDIRYNLGSFLREQ